VGRDRRASRRGVGIRSFLILVAVLAGCSVYRTRREPSGCSTDPSPCAVAGHGQHYALPKRLVKVSVSTDPETISFKEYVTVPDPDHHYVLDYLPNAFASDTVKVQTSDAGLLMLIDAKTSDESGRIILELGNAVIDASAGVPPPPTTAEKDGPAPVPFEATFDPASEAARSRFNEELRNNHFNLRIDVTCVPNSCYDPRQNSRQRSPHNTCGVLYRAPRLYKMHVRPINSDDLVGDIPLLLPQGSPILVLNITRGAFIEKQTVLSFTDGLLNKIEISKPSEVAAFIGIPIELVHTLLSLPTEVLKVKVKYLNKETAYEKALKDEHDLRVQLMHDLEAEKAKCASTPNP
jgi:hypothetical protein